MPPCCALLVSDPSDYSSWGDASPRKICLTLTSDLLPERLLELRTARRERDTEGLILQPHLDCESVESGTYATVEARSAGWKPSPILNRTSPDSIGLANESSWFGSGL